MNRTARRLTGVTGALLGVALAATACAGQPTSTAAETDTETENVFDTDMTLDELIAAAKEEGPITIYDGTSKIEEMAAAFTEEYGIEATGVKADAAEVIEKTLKFREYFGDYQRQLFLMDHAGLPLKTVLEQLDLLGEEVIPTLRKEFDALRPAHVPQAPTHESLKAAALAALADEATELEGAGTRS